MAVVGCRRHGPVPVARRRRPRGGDVAARRREIRPVAEARISGGADVFAVSIRIGDVGVPGWPLRRSRDGGHPERRRRRHVGAANSQGHGVELEQLFADWRAAAYETYATQPAAGPDDDPSPLLREAKAGRMQLGPSLSPDGRAAVFFSERDRLSLDLFLADTTTGAITRKLATTTATARFESLQPIRSAGSWNPDGDRFVFAAIAHGQPALVILDVSGPAAIGRSASATRTGLDAGVVSRRPLDRLFRVEGRRDGPVRLRSRCRNAAAAHERSVFGSAACVVAGRARDRVRHGSLLDRPRVADVRSVPARGARCVVRRRPCASCD